ncbi:MAG: hypothetical protein CL526_07535 [Aequorivita sp.]|nr:hypothetical protein [Aequorivita sp.]|tara:strand:+ start:15211 stop:15732 length:522 start_codon:yes stop_codon:yes gene_type:complete
MRKIFTIVFSLFFTGVTLGQDVNDTTRFIPESEVPKVILNQQDILYPSNFVSEWEVQELDGMHDAPNILYFAKFEEDGRPGFSAAYLPNGTLVFHSEFTPAEIIPSTVRLKVDQDYKDFEIHSAKFISLYNPERELYLVKLLAGNQMKFVFYNTVGNEIDKIELPAEILLLMR